VDAGIEVKDSATGRPRGRRSETHLKVLFAVASWGLGHATRDLPVIRRLLDDGHDVTIVSSDRALALLQRELGSRCTFLDWPDLPFKLARSAPLFYAKFTLSLPLALRAILSEHQALKRLLSFRSFDRVISDSRFGIRSRQVTSYQLAHGLRFIAPRRSLPLEVAMEYVYWRCFGQVSRFIVPDFATDDLSGELSHHLRFVRPERLAYIGILSSVRRLSLPEDIDCYVSISGREPQRTVLEDLVLKQVGDVPGRVVVSLGKPEEDARCWQVGGATIYNYVDRQSQQVLMNRARLIVSRSGYTTMMELAELGKRALLIPTLGQTEQEYLAELHRRRGTYFSVEQDRLDLPRDLSIAAQYPGYQPAHRTDTSIEYLMAVLNS
jgi:hypothetical protein